ncbi:hypothetical protein L6164_030722 [Bauhinia variegata]|nr:hypothetical protein L6164_030722 [Bauhinia variegata]
MDPELAGWILEFLLRKPVPDRIIKRILASLPILDNDSRLKKTLLLRTIQDEVSQALVSESILEYLEVIEEIDRCDGISITELMRSVYCAVAVECTVKYLSTSTDDNLEYFNAVKRIWRSRIWGMETSVEGSQLFTNELIQWRDDIEAALLDLELCVRLGNLDTKGDALSKLRDYLAETWENMGPPFLETMSAFQNLVHDFELRNDSMIEPNEDQDIGALQLNNWDEGRSDCSTDTIEDCGATHGIELDDDAVCIGEQPVTLGIQDIEKLEEKAGAAELLNDYEGRSEGSTNARGDCGVADRIELDDDERCIEGVPEKAATSDDGSQELGGSDLAMQEDGVHVEALVTDENQAHEQLDGKADTFADGSQELSRSDLPTQGERACIEEVLVTDMNQVNEQLEENVDGSQELCGSDLPPQGERVCLEEMPVTDGNQSKEQLRNKAETLVDGSQELGGKNFPTKGETGMQKGSGLLKYKHAAASYRRLKRVKINDDAEEGPETLDGSYDPLPSSEVNKVRESLKSSSLELKALVKDPLPEALQRSDIVRSDLAIKDMLHELPIENQSKESFQPNDANIGGKSSVYKSFVCRPSLMERNSTAQTYQWSNSIDDLPGETSEYASKFHLPSPKRTDVSPLERYEPQKFISRRRARKWSLLEEDTLRAGVQRFGKGYWKEILISYPDIFEERTEVDLKDKWRNMTRYGDQ